MKKPGGVLLNMKLSYKLCLIYTVLLLCVLLTVNGVDQYLYARDMRVTTTALFEQICMSFESVMNQMLNNMDALAKAPLYSDEMQTELEKAKPLSSESIGKLYYAAEVIGVKDRLRYVISLYDSTGRLTYSSAAADKSYISKRYYGAWYAAAKPLNGAACIVGFPEEETEYACAIARIIKNLTRFNDVGLMTVSIPTSVFDAACEKVRDVPGGRAALLDGEGNVIYDSRSGAREEEIPPELFSRIASGGERTLETDRYIGYFARGGKYSVLVYTELATLMAGQRQTAAVMRLCLLLVCLLALTLTVAVANGATRPLRKITALMEQVQRGNRDVRFNALGRDEVGVLGRNFNVMLDKMNEMTERLVEVSTSKKQAEIDALQAQINPHFMYNTLETFRMMAVEKDDYELADLICAFGKMLRYNITTFNEMTTIQREIEYLENYIHIQNRRCGQEILLRCDVPDALEDTPILKLLIQPIVENAVFHGLEMKRKKRGLIELRARREGGLLLLDVSDNGLGMTSERLAELKRILTLSYAEAKETAHIGLRNVSERVRLYYGEPYGITIESAQNRGTIVRITLPLRETGSGAGE